jgi:thiosulfate reductase cytochrome b subunit
MSRRVMKTEVPKAAPASHTLWVRVTHWIVTLSFLLLTVSGFEILMVHPRLYWGNAGNDLTPAWLELPISRNYRHGGWEDREAFFPDSRSPVTASRTFRTFNRNSWGRSLHFLAGWLLVTTGLVYLWSGLFSGHFRRDLLPRRRELHWRSLWDDLRENLSRGSRSGPAGLPYGLVQRWAYIGVVFVALPLTALTGFAMSPAITAAHPWLLDLWGGFQSARSVHFLLAVALLLFLGIHVAKVAQSGLRRQLRAMTLGPRHG